MLQLCKIFSKWLLLSLTMVFGLAGCNLVADKPLALSSDRVALLPDNFVGEFLVSKDQTKQSNNKKKQEYRLKRSSNNRYDIYGITQSKPETLTGFMAFYPFPGYPEHHLVEVVLKAKDTALDPNGKTTYLAGEFSNDLLSLTLMGVGKNADFQQALKSAAIDYEVLKQETKLTSRDDLLAYAKLWMTSKTGRAFQNGEAIYYLRASQSEQSSPEQALDRVVHDCLAATVHPLDPSRLKLDKEYQFGLWQHSIDTDTAIDLCRKANKVSNSPSVRYGLIRALMLNGEYNFAKPMLSELREEKFELADNMYADMLKTGKGYKKDLKAAEMLLEKLAKNGSVPARISLGQLLLGKSDAASKRRGFEMMQAVYDDGHHVVASLVGFNLDRGIGVEKNAVKAFAYNKLAADNGDPFGHLGLGDAYYNGTVVAQNYKLARTHYDFAADYNFTQGMFMLGVMDASGFGLDQNKPNKVRAARRFREASAQGHADAKAHWARLIWFGYGSRKANRPRAIKLLKEAQSAGSASAKSILDQLQGRKQGLKKGNNQDSKTQLALNETVQNSNWRKGTDKNHVELVDRLIEGKSVKLTVANQQLLAGIAKQTTATCGFQLAEQQRATLDWFVAGNFMVASGFSTLIGKVPKSALKSTSKSINHFGSGMTLVKKMGCSTTLATVNNAIIKAIDQSHTEKSAFLTSCSKSLSKQQCSCVLRIFEAVDPGVSSSRYQGQLLRRMYRDQPHLKIESALQCKIKSY